MITINSVKVNGSVFTVNPIEISADGFSLQWELSENSEGQTSYDLRVSSSSANHGNNNFNGDIANFSNVNSVGTIQRINLRRYLNRNSFVFGQVRCRSNATVSDWFTFKMTVPPLPFIRSAVITPASPFPSDNLNISYDPSNSDSNIEIKWYKNGSEQSILRNNSSVSYTSISPGDVWHAEVRPYNKYGEGISYITSEVQVSKPIPLVSGVEILPRDATVDDILEAIYKLEDASGVYSDIQDESLFDWFVNDELVAEAYGKFARLNLNPGDSVYVRIRPSITGFQGTSVISNKIFVKKSDVNVFNMMIDGQKSGSVSSSPSPSVSWEVEPRKTSDIENFEVKIGTAPGASDIGLFVLPSSSRSFAIPSGAIKRGSEYYVSVKPRTFQNVPSSASIISFRTSGSIWKEEVDNNIGWTIFLKLSVNKYESQGGGQEGDLQSAYSLSIADGTFSFKLIIYTNLINIIANTGEVVSYVGDNTNPISLFIGVQNRSLKIFRNGSVIFDRDDALILRSGEKYVRFDEEPTLNGSEINLYSMYLSVNGRRLPGDPGYGDLAFYKFASFPNAEITSFGQYGGNVLAGINNLYPDDYPSIYEINPFAPKVECDLSSFNVNDFVINKIVSSKVGDTIAVATNKGCAIISGGVPVVWDSIVDNITQDKLLASGWSIYADNISESVAISAGTISINTKPVNASPTIPSISSGTLKVISIQQKGVFEVYNFSLSGTTITATPVANFVNQVSTLQFTLTDNKTIEQLVSEMLSTQCSATSGINLSYFYNILVANEMYAVPSSYIIIVTGSLNQSVYDVLADADALGMQSEAGLPAALSSGSKGGAHIYQSSPGTPWYENVDPHVGYSFEIDISVSNASEALDSSDDSILSNLSFSDGEFKADVQLMEDMVKVGRKAGSVNLANNARLRFSSKHGQVDVYDMNSTDVNPLLSFSMEKSHTDVGELAQIRSVSIRDENHVIGLIGTGNKANFYHRIYKNNEWSDLGKIFDSDSDFGSFDLCSFNDDIFIVFEMNASGRGEIGVARRSLAGWSKPLRITSAIGDSKNPRIASDSAGGIHVVWEDERNGNNQIFYASQNASNYEWNSSAFSGSDIALTSPFSSARRPYICSSDGKVYVVFEELDANISKINAVFKDISTDIWNGYAGSGASIQVSGAEAISAKSPFVESDLTGTIHVIWTDEISSKRRVLTRTFGANLVPQSTPRAITSANDNFDCILESVGLDLDSGDLIISMTKNTSVSNNSGIAFDESVRPDANYRLFTARFHALIRQWRSSGSAGVARGQPYGGYDVEIVPAAGDIRSMFGSCIPKTFKSIYPLVYKSRRDPESPGLLIGRVAVLNSDYAGRTVGLGLDPYLSSDDIVFGETKSKYIRIGDYGGVLSADMSIARLGIYAKGALSPLHIKSISSASYNMPSIDVNSLVVSSQKDAWIAGGDKILFYDSVRDNVFEATGGDFFEQANLDPYWNGDNKVTDIYFDKNGVFYIEYNKNGNSFIAASLGPSFFTYFDFDVKVLKMRVDGNGDAILVANDGIRIAKQFSTKTRKFLIDFADPYYERPLPVDSVYGTKLIYSGSFNVYDAAVSDLGVVFFASNRGIIRCDGGESVGVFGREFGLDQSTVKSVSIGMNNRVFCCTNSAVYEFSGSSFYKVDIFGYERAYAEVPPGFDSDITGVAVSDNFICVSTKQSVYFATEVSGRGIGSIWSSRALSRSALDLIRNNQQSDILRDQFKISDPDIDALGGLTLGITTDVYINGHIISRGYGLSVSEKILKLYAPLLSSDKLSVVLRKDILKVVDLKQKKSEINDVGIEKRNILGVGVLDGEYAAALGGTRHRISMWNDDLALPNDDIVLDREAPEGVARLAERISSDTIKIRISNTLRGQDGFNEEGWVDTYDASSGIDKMQISNYDNFTIDGINPSPMLAFSSEVIHQLVPVVTTGTLLENISNGFGSCITSFRFAQGTKTRIAYATGAPASVFISSDALSFDSVPSISFEGGSTDYEVTAMFNYNLKLYVAVSRIDGTGGCTLYSTQDGIVFLEVVSLGAAKISAISKSNYDNKLYFCAHAFSGAEQNPVGELYSFDGNLVTTVASGLGDRANSIACIDRFVYVGTGSPARIYRYDIVGRFSEILLSEGEDDVLSLTTVGAGIYAGVSQSSRIFRSSNPGATFVQSFITIPDDVLFGTSFQIEGETRPYFSVGNKLFTYDSAWTALARADTPIVGICSDDFGNLFYISQNEVKSVSAPNRENLRNVFVKLIDRAGNETDIRGGIDIIPEETNGDGFNDDLTVRIVPTNASGDVSVGGGISNRLIEYDLNGQVLLDIQGDNQFYSGFRIEKESGIYESPVLPGASAHVSWESISWTGTMPAGTDIEIMIRSAATRDALLSTPYSVKFSWEESGADISFMPGAFIQFKIQMTTTTDISPRVDSLTITENVGAVSNVITTLFELPSDIRRGIITTDSEIPSGGAIIAGITLQDSIDFAQYQEVPLDRMFEPSPSNRGKNLRIGFKLLSPRPSEDIIVAPPPSPSDPNVPLSLNTMQWIYQNTLTGSVVVDFRVNFFRDSALSDFILSADTIGTPSTFKIDGNPFPVGGGAIFASGQTRGMSLIPSGFPFECNRSYFATVEASINGADFEAIAPAKTEFFKQCGTNFLDIITFTYLNRAQSGRFHFRVSIYNDFERNNLVTSFFSYYSLLGWTSNGLQMISDGVAIGSNQSSTIQFVVPRVQELVDDATYYITIQAYNLDDPDAGFSFNDTSYSFRLRQISEGINCGPISNVPVIRGFAMMFELEDGSLVKMRFDA